MMMVCIDDYDDDDDDGKQINSGEACVIEKLTDRDPLTARVTL